MNKENVLNENLENKEQLEVSKEQLQEQIQEVKNETKEIETKKEQHKSQLELLMEQEQEKIFLAKQLAQAKVEREQMLNKVNELQKEIDKIKNDKKINSTFDIEIVEAQPKQKNLDDPKVRLQELFKNNIKN